MVDIKNRVKCTIIKPPYKWRTTSGTVIYDYRSAHTVINPGWKWWKFWIERFLSIPAGWHALFNISGNIELNQKPGWVFYTQPEIEKAKNEPEWQ